jgi:hypothetical protein
MASISSATFGQSSSASLISSPAAQQRGLLLGPQ